MVGNNLNLFPVSITEKHYNTEVVFEVKKEIRSHLDAE